MSSKTQRYYIYALAPLRYRIPWQSDGSRL
jgi:hypothetical protein